MLYRDGSVPSSARRYVDCIWCAVLQRCYKSLKMIKFDVAISWAATLVIVAATIATALDIIPLNKILFLLGCILWAWVGFLWKKPSLWSLNIFCGIVYILGFLLKNG